MSFPDFMIVVLKIAASIALVSALLVVSGLLPKRLYAVLAAVCGVLIRLLVVLGTIFFLVYVFR